MNSNPPPEATSGKKFQDRESLKLHLCLFLHVGVIQNKAWPLVLVTPVVPVISLLNQLLCPGDSIRYV